MTKTEFATKEWCPAGTVAATWMAIIALEL